MICLCSLFKTLFKMIYLLLIFAVFASISDAIVQDFYWRDYVHGDIPYDAVQGASGRYIGQVIYQGNILPATIYPHKNVALAEYGGKRSIEKNIKILCSSEPNRFYWERVSFNKPSDQQMKNVVKGGYQENINLNLFIGRTIHENDYKIGKVVEIDSPSKGLYVWTNGGSHFRCLEFEILKYNSTIVGSDGSIIFKH